MSCTDGPKRHDDPEWLTTGEAARICSVTADAVQKWIRRGRLTAQRTAGGHYRIARHELEPFATARSEARWFAAPPSKCKPQPFRCWEYLSCNGVIHDDCLKCVVYRIRASWCFAVLGRQEGSAAGHSQRFCRAQSSCQECAYYQQVCSIPARVLVIGPVEEMRAMLLGAGGPSKLSFEFAASGYQAAILVGVFRPLFVVVDEELLGRAEESGLLDNLAHESRIPGLKIILAVSNSSQSLTQRDFIDGFLVKPFDATGLAAFVDNLPIERVGLETRQAI